MLGLQGMAFCSPLSVQKSCMQQMWENRSQKICCHALLQPSQREENFYRRPEFFSNKSMAINATYKIDGESKRKYVTLFINGFHIRLQLDTGSDITLISRDIRRELGQPPLLPTHHTARNASGGTLKLAGEVTCEMTFGDNRIETCCFLTDYSGLDLLGLDWMDDLKLLDRPVNSLRNRMKIHSRSETPPNCNTQGGTSPTESMVGRKIHTRFDNIRPSPLTSENEEVHRTNYAQCIRHFNIGDSVPA
ncbi:uncharacterized protein DEA37_0006421 [Paragonimus westermani]|uniref:Peptidase A2 domain-containing protein n=1 Tax=Paragonimus westermani TaxID=34504 RepID=A0A5J4N2R3_9TREM|nr:uncharacterized protein DEA37_0006421 [Paragonimus westermani]